MKKIKLIFFGLAFTCFFKSLLAIDPVEIGKPYQSDIETNLSIIEDLNKNIYEEKIKIKKDIRTKLKKKEIINKDENFYGIEEKLEIEKTIDKKLARIVEIEEKINDQIQILFNSETANLKDNDISKIKGFVNKIENKENLAFKITSYAKNNKNEDASRRLSLDRAINIRSILLKEGIPAKNLIVKSFGDTKNKENKVIIEFEKK
ncbi:MAG: hypothetical protein CMI94_02770 [Pelagibacteraceae bacterium]|nr:hypothetical protein [Pelagibacteraceae bacterium]